MKQHVFAAVVVLLVLTGLAPAQSPGAMNYQGRLVENGELVNRSGVRLRLRVYDSPTATSPVIYEETDTINVVDGLYSTALGDNRSGGTTRSIPEAFEVVGPNAWLGVKFNDEPELTPREPLYAAAYAMTVRGIFVSRNGYVGIGTDSPGEMLHVEGALRIEDGSEGSGKVLTSDGNGSTSWQAPAAGGVLQFVYTNSGAYASLGSAAIPRDDTVPQKTEGNEAMVLSITPRSASSTLAVDVRLNIGTSAADLILALFRDDQPDALATTICARGGYDDRTVPYTLRYRFPAGSISPTTLKVRVGSTASTALYLNGRSGRLFGGTMDSSMTITEFSAD